MLEMDKEFMKDFFGVWKNKKIPTASGILNAMLRLRSCFILPSTEGHYKDIKNLFIMKICLWLQVFDQVLHFGGSFLERHRPILFLESMVNCIGAALILYKTYDFQTKADNLVKLVRSFESMYSRYVKTSDLELESLIRKRYVENYIVNFGSGYFLGPGLLISYCLPPILLRQRIFPILAYFPWNTRTSDIGFVAAYMFQTFILSWKLFVIVAIDSFGVGIVHYSNVLLEILSHRMEKLWKTKDTSNSLNYKIEFLKLVKEHQKVLVFVKRLNKVLSNSLVAQVISSTFMLCLSGFQIVIGLQQNNIKIVINYVMYFIAVMSQLIFWCYNGNKIFWTVNINLLGTLKP